MHTSRSSLWSGFLRSKPMRSSSAGCSSAGPPERPSRRQLGRGRSRCRPRPNGWRRRWRPWSRYLLELETGQAEGRTWFGEVGQAELVDWAPVLARAGVVASPHRVAAAYLELAVLIRALEGLSAAVEFGASPDRASLWAGLFDLRENLLGRVQDDFHALAA
jgi:hypothetical protein